ncbi:MAG: carboxypeptidase M32 [Defluviitaleaceae bacterium]|nr:carboxypeptidase M32 [Defluviitaleaceae bacterium]
MQLTKTIEDFKAYLERIGMFAQAMSILSFDSETIAPEGGLEIRAKRAGFFQLEVYNMATSDTMKGFLEALEPHQNELDEHTKAIYRLTKKKYDEATKFPPELVQAYAQLREESGSVWRKARVENNYKAFAPYLKRLIEMKKQMLELRADEIPEGGQPYDIFLDDFEEGMTIKQYDDFFEKLKATVVPLIKQVAASKKKIDTSFMNTKVDIPTQREISKLLSNRIGYDLNRGYIGEAMHPFCMGTHKTDVRITTHYYEEDFLSSFYSVMHEIGHAVYEQNVGDDIADNVLGSGASSGIHESQSRLYENIIGRNLAFWEHITDELKALLPKEFVDITPHMFYEAANESKPSLIRVEADELTYSMHVIIRYEIEKMIFDGEADVDDLPAIWNQKYQDYLGITPPDDADGVMQDIHWSMGLFGYFPTYALGSAYAAQMLHYMNQEFDVNQLIRNGEFAKITNWLTNKIHRHGSIYPPNQLVKQAFGEELDGEYYAKYLKDKFSKLYQL